MAVCLLQVIGQGSLMIDFEEIQSIIPRQTVRLWMNVRTPRFSVLSLLFGHPIEVDRMVGVEQIAVCQSSKNILLP